ncbi:hypothetical protein C0Q70_19837 [Pomacea canaliculata]|uniref:Arrestin C-terminal-like domain-containing protein n=1 Tax=Pomacea canaliculata TaxID=400727 RepID=A0A2T7NDU6_POMCA|nr:hypothetical protein C0Q70_19837 [Pomacea canaliculata]
MGKLKRFDIVFNSAQGVFFAGQVVCGTVEVELSEAMKLRGERPIPVAIVKKLRMTCFGRAYVHWSEVENVGHRGGRQRIETVEYSADEEYFQYKFILWTLESKSEESECMSAGVHSFPFSMELPLNLPPSFEGDYGYIRYWAKATMDRPWKFDHHTKRAFTVISNLDLNEEPGIADSLQYHGEISAGCCCMPSGRFSGRFCTNYRGFVPGADLMLYSEIENFTRSSCWCEFKLKLLVTYVAGRKYKQEKKVIKRIQQDEIQRGHSCSWTEAMQIPPLPPSHLKGCKLITTQYFLQFVVSSDASCSCDDIEFEDEVIIGTIPLAPALPPPSPCLTKSPLDPDSAAASKSKKHKGPPTYEESVFGEVSIREKDDSEDTSGSLTFTPRYSFYHSKTSG